jgi:hypothetical protein
VRCNEKHQLIELFKAGVAHYSATVNDLNLTRGKISENEYDRLMSLVEEARVTSETARLTLDRHIQKHGC